ncbi:ATP-binding protein [Nisaea acidiphila]|uniref:histidine kinase n=1 Tax=Nisaea acidiphila TaxID=1862145 RepID=A0A9J7B1L6_9PROT|nr:ATP-binding protein [Nisaea acidiphila]UUX51557.1 ATP-binding protein [Nisaea acidiphila]
MPFGNFRYATIVAAASFGALLAITTAIVWFGYLFAEKSFDAEFERQDQHYKSIAELHFATELGELRTFLRALSHNGELLGALKEDTHQRVERILSWAYFDRDNGQLDILFIVPEGSDTIIDVSSALHETGPMVATLATEPVPTVPQLRYSETGGQTGIYALLDGFRIIDPGTGAVIANLYGGLVLNDNPYVFRGLLGDTELHAAALSIDGDIVIEVSNDGKRHFEPGGAEPERGREIVLPISIAETRHPITLRALRESNPVQELRGTFFQLLPVLIGLILVLSLALSLFIKQVTKRSLSQLTDYADAIGAALEGKSNIPQFKPGRIRDFNSLGEAIERVFDAFRASEHRATEVIDRAPSAIIAKDLDGRYLIANKEFLSMFSLERDQVIGAKDGDLFDPAFVTEIQAFEASFGKGRTGRSREVLVPTPYGERACLAAMFPLRSEAGETYAHCTILADITDRKKAEIALRHAKEEAEFANSAKTSFLAGVSHELRTPLNAIIGFSEMIGGEVLGKIENRNYVDYAKHIQSSGTHLLSLIGDVLDLSVIESRKETVHEEALDIEDLGESCIRMIRDQATDAGIELSSDIDMRGRALKADARRIRQILINLLTNAVKFTSAGGHVSLTGQVQDDGRIRFIVTDDGIGMDEVTLAHAFEPFMQGNSSMVRKAEGAGLGLALVKRLVELHGADLECNSAPGAGTTISILFPASRSVTAPPQAAEAEQAPAK